MKPGALNRIHAETCANMKTFLLLTAVLATRLFAPLDTGMLAASARAESARTPDHDYDAPAPGTYTLPVIKPAADGDLLDITGKPVRLREVTRGRVTVLSFIYTRCGMAKACPYATGVLLQLHQASTEDAELARQLRLVSLSFDPENDTPKRMAEYAGVAGKNVGAAPWHFLTARSQTDLAPILAAYGQAVDKKQNPQDPAGPLNHTLRVFLIDREGRIRNIYSSGMLDLRLVLADARTLMLESSGATPLSTSNVQRSTSNVQVE
jgi:protein SCO1/2